MSDQPSLSERKALNWYRVNGPAEISASGAPSRAVRIALIRGGWVHISPLNQYRQFRRLGDAILYDLTERGREILRGFE